jgi:hypothetical protein
MGNSARSLNWDTQLMLIEFAWLFYELQGVEIVLGLGG